MISPRATIATIGTLATTLALAGCVSVGVHVASPEGVGECDSNPVSLSVTQNGKGDHVTIEYNGPMGYSLIAYQGMYSDSRFWNMNQTESIIFNYPAGDLTHDYAMYALNIDSAPWTQEITGVELIKATYDGPIESFVSGLDNSQQASDTDYAFSDKILPVTIAVVCSDDIPSAIMTSPTIDSDNAIDVFEVAVAQAFYPNFMYVDPPTVTRQQRISHGVRGQMILPTEMADVLPDDIGPISVGLEVAYIGENDPFAPVSEDQPYSLTDASLGDLWLLTIDSLLGGPGDLNFQITGDSSLTKPMSFEFSGDTQPANGYYLVTMSVGEDVDNPDHVKVAMAVMQYSAQRGLTLEGLRQQHSPAEKLAFTGSDPNVITWSLLGGLVLLGAVFLRPKRRKVQAGSTNAPSDLK